MTRHQWRRLIDDCDSQQRPVKVASAVVAEQAASPCGQSGEDGDYPPPEPETVVTLLAC
jgi:hypothetical protein